MRALSPSIRRFLATVTAGVAVGSAFGQTPIDAPLDPEMLQSPVIEVQHIRRDSIVHRRPVTGPRASSDRQLIMALLNASRNDFNGAARTLNIMMLRNRLPKAEQLVRVFGTPHAYQEYVTHLKALPSDDAQTDTRWFVLALHERLLKQAAPAQPESTESESQVVTPSQMPKRVLGEPKAEPTPRIGTKEDVLKRLERLRTISRGA